jgi:hypothetical protein
MATTTTTTHTIACLTCSGTGTDPTFHDRCEPCHGTGRKATAVAMPVPASAEVQAQVADLAAWLATQQWSEFAVSLAAAYARTGTLSEKQVAAATSMRAKCAAKAAAKAQAAPAAAAAVEAAPALDLRHLPSGRYAVPNGATRLKLQIDVLTTGKWAGWVFVKDAAVYGEGRKYGSQRPGQGYQGQAVEALQAIAADPQAAMAAYGHLTSTCGRCNRPLEDEASVERGIGPVCLGKLGW